MNALKIILKQLNIQVDNPICILNQDFARIFLIISDDTKMYEFFSKATQIDALMQKLEEMETDLDDSEKRLDEAIEVFVQFCMISKSNIISIDINNIMIKY